MFKDQISIKGLLVGFFGYLLISTVAMAIVVHHWMPSGITDPQELSRLAESDPTLLMWQNILGVVLSILAGFAACHFSGAKGLKTPLILGALFVLYGALGIYLHPNHPALMQAGKLLAPIPLVLFGAWIRLKLALQPGAPASNA
jgi:hypothetical protein